MTEIEQQVLSLKDDDDIIYKLATLVYDRGSDVLPFIKKHFPLSYVKVLESYIMGNHDT